jgi:pimeloyl-ACP methyl ester carboxylesterase
LVGHSLGAAVAVRAVSGLGRVVGVFSIEGNLTAADAYLSGLATAFQNAADYRNHLLARVSAMAEDAACRQTPALLRYHESVSVAAAEPLWRIGLSATAASRQNALGAEYRALSVPTLYYWSKANTPPETREYILKHALRNCEFSGGHWPMVEQPEETARQIAAFFRPMFLASQRLVR